MYRHSYIYIHTYVITSTLNYKLTRIKIYYVYYSLQLMTADEQTQIGKISKKFGGIFREAFTAADTFGISCKTCIKCV